jgi:hypothetical protein
MVKGDLDVWMRGYWLAARAVDGTRSGWVNGSLSKSVGRESSWGCRKECRHRAVTKKEGVDVATKPTSRAKGWRMEGRKGPDLAWKS